MMDPMTVRESCEFSKKKKKKIDNNKAKREEDNANDAAVYENFYLAPRAPGFRSSRSRSVNISAGAAEWDLWRDRSKMGPPPRDRYLPPISSDATSVPDR